MGGASSHASVGHGAVYACACARLKVIIVVLEVNDYPIKVQIHRYTMKTHLRWLNCQLQTVFVRQYM